MLVMLCTRHALTSEVYPYHSPCTTPEPGQSQRFSSSCTTSKTCPWQCQTECPSAWPGNGACRHPAVPLPPGAPAEPRPAAEPREQAGAAVRPARSGAVSARLQAAHGGGGALVHVALPAAPGTCPPMWLACCGSSSSLMGASLSLWGRPGSRTKVLTTPDALGGQCLHSTQPPAPCICSWVCWPLQCASLRNCTQGRGRSSCT